MRLFAFTCGWLTGPTGPFLDGEHGTIRMPGAGVPDPASAGRRAVRHRLRSGRRARRKGTPGFLADVFATELGTGDVVGARLAALDVTPERLRHVVLSHLRRPRGRPREACRTRGSRCSAATGICGSRRRHGGALTFARQALRSRPRRPADHLTASTTSATDESSAYRRTATRRGRSRCACASTQATSCSPPTPATCAARSRPTICRRAPSTARRCSRR